MTGIKRNVAISIEPSVDEIANIIWSMDSEQQASLLEQLTFIFQEIRMNGYIQMLAIAEDIKKRDMIRTVGKFIDDIHEYIGYDALQESEVRND
jgi:hypothetical protein